MMMNSRNLKVIAPLPKVVAPQPRVIPPLPKVIAPLIILALVLIVGADHASARSRSTTLYENSGFIVRQDQDQGEPVCILDIAFQKNGKDAAILSLPASRDFFGLLITERRTIGLAEKRFEITFNGGNKETVDFARVAPGKDSAWRWRYFDKPSRLIPEIKSGKWMRIVLSNGQRWFSLKKSLKGSANAVRYLNKCHRGR